MIRNILVISKTMAIKKRYIVIFFIVLLSVFLIYTERIIVAQTLLDKDSIKATNMIEATIPTTPNPFPLLGVGVQFDPFFFSINVPMGNGAKEADWNRVICPRVRSMRIQRYRVGVLPHWWENYNDNDDPYDMDASGFTWDNDDMQSLYKVLDLAERTGADVNLVLWGCPRYGSLSMGEKGVKYMGRYFMADNGTHWVTGPVCPEEFAENFTALLIHLIIDKGYTCIKEITPFNEPDGSVLNAERYVLCFKSLDSFLRKAGLRNKVCIIASDNIGQNVSFLKKCAEQLSKEADLFCSHTYNFGYNSTNDDVFEWEKINLEITSSTGKPHFIGEFGSNEIVGVTRQKDIDEYKRGVLLCRLAIDFINAGAVSVNYWTLFDHFREMTSSLEDIQQLGLWRYVSSIYNNDPFWSSKQEDYQVRPQYYAYSLLTRNIRKGDLVYPLLLHNDYVAGTALFHKNNKWTYLFANGSDESLFVKLVTSKQKRRVLKSYEYRIEMLPRKGKQLSVSYRLKLNKEGSLFFHLPANSVLVLSE